MSYTPPVICLAAPGWWYLPPGYSTSPPPPPSPRHPSTNGSVLKVAVQPIDFESPSRINYRWGNWHERGKILPLPHISIYRIAVLILLTYKNTYIFAPFSGGVGLFTSVYYTNPGRFHFQIIVPPPPLPLPQNLIIWGNTSSQDDEERVEINGRDGTHGYIPGWGIWRKNRAILERSTDTWEYNDRYSALKIRD